VLYLGSDEAQFVFGQIICCDGGIMSHHPGWADGKGALDKRQRATT
jgi:hypothetical protein